jgi:N-acetylglucosaminyl-diphospho-decaprenol L-rhamnosyltransferase
MSAKICAIVVSYDSAGDLDAMLPRLIHPDIDVIVIDNASHDASAGIAEAVRGVRVVRLPVNVGWSRACNLGAGMSQAESLAFVNPDARPSGDDLLRLASRLGNDVAAISPRFVWPDGRAQAFYFRFPGLITGTFCMFPAGQRVDAALGGPVIGHRCYNNGRQLPRSVDQPGAACLVVSRVAFEERGGFEPALFLFFADTLLHLQIKRAGLRTCVAWDIDVPHAMSASVRAIPADESVLHLQRDYLTYACLVQGRAALRYLQLCVLLLTGLIPAAARLVRRDLSGAGARLQLAFRILR